jgi:hypothetical protein
MTVDPAPHRERPPVLASIGRTPVVRLIRHVEPDMAEICPVNGLGPS